MSARNGNVCTALVPLSKHLQPIKQVWYADDATGCDKFEKLRRWFDELLVVGPVFPKPVKCILVTKPDRFEHAKKVFRGSGVQVQVEGSKDSGIEINCEGTRHLGAAIGSSSFKQSYIKLKVDGWIHAVKKLAGIAATHTRPMQPLRTVFKANGPFFLVPCLIYRICLSPSKM